MFLRHGDPSDHTPFGLLNLVFRGLTLGTFSNLLEDLEGWGLPQGMSNFV